MAYSQLRAASLPLPTRSPLFARRSMSDPVVTARQLPEFLERPFVPIISIDHLSQHYQDLPVDDILALGDQALLHQFQRAFYGTSKSRTSQTTWDQGQMCSGMFQELKYMPQVLMPETAQAQSQSQPTRALSRPTRAQSPEPFSIDETELPFGCLSKDPTQLVCDPQPEQHNDLLPTHNDGKDGFGPHVNKLYATLASLKILPGTMGNRLLQDHLITEPEVIGPLVNNLYGTLTSLKSRHEPCEVLLYLSGHGIDPGNICLVPDAMKPHPTRSEHDLRKIDPEKWYKYDDRSMQEANQAESYLEDFYHNYAKAITKHNGPLGFVGGEVYAHHRGFIGVLGVLGLWCYAHHEYKGDTYHHLVIVADCCFAGIWGATLDRIMKSGAPCLEGYRELLLKYPVSIQCATNEFEASHGGLFTPLWYFLQTATEQQLRNYRATFNESEPMSDDEMETQHPCYVSTSQWCPTWKYFDDPAFFLYLQNEQLKALKLDLRNEENLEAWRGACIPQTPEPVEITECDVEKGFEHLTHFSPIVQPLMTAFVATAFNLRGLLYKTESRLICYGRYPDTFHKEMDRDEQAKRNIEDSLAALQVILCETVDLYLALMPRSRNLPCNYFLSGDNLIDKLIDAYGKELRKQVKKKPRDGRYDVAPGVYVFQGGKGDMSLIVTPGNEQVILIDGTCNAECFIAAWNSILRYLQRITHIFVTHHDEDHTYGIQLLLARYCVGQTGIPDISSTTIYMNTRAALRLRSFGHEKEIESLVEMLRARNLILAIEPVIIDDLPERLVNDEHLFVLPLLPTRELVETCYSKVPEEGSRKKYTGTVYSRGLTTAANVLSINLVAVWKNRDAYLFTGDAHLKDVTQAARRFLDDHDGIDSFKYVDVPHHGSANSNVKNVDPEDHGLAGIPAEHYLISHCGNHDNPSFQTVKDILKREDREITLHFLYERRKYEPNKNHRTCSSKKCKDTRETIRNWYCTCVSKEEQAKIRYPREHKYEYFGFAD